MFKSGLYTFLFSGFLLLSSSHAISAEESHVTAQMLSEVDSARPGQTFWVGVHLKMDPGWHTYWKNPGDSGLATKIKWDLPEGFTVGEIQWPFPIKIDAPPLSTYGYEKEVLLLSEISISHDVEINTPKTLKAVVSWLACQVDCIPGKAELQYEIRTVSGRSQIHSENLKQIENAKRKLPFESDEWLVSAEEKGDYFQLRVESKKSDREVPKAVYPPAQKTQCTHGDECVRSSASGEMSPLAVAQDGPRRRAKGEGGFRGTAGMLAGLHFFPESADLIDHAAAQEGFQDDTGYTLFLEKSSIYDSLNRGLSGILVSEKPWPGGLQLQALNVTTWIAPSSPKSSNLLFYTLLAFLGGLILNLMPCVLPVLSLKVLHFSQKAAQDKTQVWKYGLSFSAGMVSTFLALAGILMILREAGQHVGWGFQLQSPFMIMSLSALFLLFALNLWGVFEMGLPLTRLGSDSRISGHVGSFSNGILATLVATPCTAPFMGSAIGFSFTQPMLISLWIFFMLGIGMAFPYLILSFFPNLVGKIPKPGPWMLKLKRILSIPLFLTLLWLAWVFVLQKGGAFFSVLVLQWLLLVLACLFYGRWQRENKKGKLGRALALLVFCLSFLTYLPVALWARAPGTVRSPALTEREIQWQVYSEEKVTAARKQEVPVFIDFTAAWCLTCQVNDRVALNSEEVVRRFKELKVIAFKADWTSHDPEITKALGRYGRHSIPLYVLYGVGENAPPEILPELLTPHRVLEALEKIRERTFDSL